MPAAHRVIQAAGGLPPIELTYIGTAEDGDNSVNFAGLSPAEGDLVIMLQYGLGDGTPSFSQPSGYTQMVSETSGIDSGSQAAYKVIGAAESSCNTGSTGTAEMGTIIFLYRPSRPITSVSYGTWNKQATEINPSSQNVDPSALPEPVVVVALAAAQSTGSFNFSTASPAFDATPSLDTGNGFLRAGVKLYNTAPQSHTVDMGDEGAKNVLISGYVAVS